MEITRRLFLLQERAREFRETTDIVLENQDLYKINDRPNELLTDRNGYQTRD